MTVRWLPAWVRHYDRVDLGGDLTAGLIVTMLLVPQGLAFAALAGLPPQYGLYASVLPLVVYALFGSSMVMSVGPVAIAALMTAVALAPVATPGTPEYIAAAAALALLSGAMLFVFGLLRLGALAQFLSHPVITGFIAGAALLIVIGQIGPLLGIPTAGHDAADLLLSIFAGVRAIEWLTAAIGLTAMALLWLSRWGLERALLRVGLVDWLAQLLPRLMPMVVVVIASVMVALFGWDDRVRVVGELPAGVPSLVLPGFSVSLIGQLWLPALIIGLVGYIESVSIAREFAARRGQRIDADAELRGLGAANMVSGFSGAFPVAGGLSRTAVNAEAGARTPLAGVIAALLIVIVLLFGTGLFRSLPLTVLAATIIVIALGLIDLKAIRHAWRYDRAEGLALLFTVGGVLVAGVEVGIAIGIGLSLATLIWRASHPHIAVLGRVDGTQHFRNVERFEVETCPGVLMLRIDENLFFGNAEAVERHIIHELDHRPDVRDLVLVMSSVSYVDATALEMLAMLNRRLRERDTTLHFAEVKGPVLDRLGQDQLLDELGGTVHLSTWEAFDRLSHRS